MENIIVRIEGSQSFEAQDDIISLTLSGILEREANKYIITYEESEVTGLMNTTTQIVIDTDGEVTLNRIGDNNSCLVFKEGQKNISYYETTEGSFTIGIYTNYLEIEITDKEGEINIDYSMEVDGKFIGDNTINLNFNI